MCAPRVCCRCLNSSPSSLTTTARPHTRTHDLYTRLNQYPRVRPNSAGEKTSSAWNICTAYWWRKLISEHTHINGIFISQLCSKHISMIEIRLGINFTCATHHHRHQADGWKHQNRQDDGPFWNIYPNSCLFQNDGVFFRSVLGLVSAPPNK